MKLLKENVSIIYQRASISLTAREATGIIVVVALCFFFKTDMGQEREGTKTMQM